jgi:hypothetical protein
MYIPLACWNLSDISEGHHVKENRKCAHSKTLLEYSSCHSKKRILITNGTSITLQTYLTMVNTKSMVMLGTMTATITNVTYYNHT